MKWIESFFPRRGRHFCEKWYVERPLLLEQGGFARRMGTHFLFQSTSIRAHPAPWTWSERKLLWLKDLAQNNNFLLYCSATFIQNDKINIMKYQIIVFSVPFKSYCFVIGWPAIFCVSMAFLCCLSNWFHLVGFDCIESRPLKYQINRPFHWKVIIILWLDGQPSFGCLYFTATVPQLTRLSVKMPNLSFSLPSSFCNFASRVWADHIFDKLHW